MRHTLSLLAHVRPASLWRMAAICVLVPASLSAGGSVTVQQKPEPKIIDVVASRFRFDPAVIELIVGEPVLLRVRSADGPHGFAIPELRIDKEIERGPEPQKIEFTPTAVGEYEIACTVSCGDGHDDMKGALVVVARKPEGAK